jgi:hypothetical protein
MRFVRVGQQIYMRDMPLHARHISTGQCAKGNRYVSSTSADLIDLPDPWSSLGVTRGESSTPRTGGGYIISIRECVTLQ